MVLSGSGRPVGGANVSVCAPVATTAATANGSLLVFTMASNPITAGYKAGATILVAGFTGGDTGFNAGTLTGNVIVGGDTILAVSSVAVTVSTSLTHVASTNGTLLQMGSATVSCAGLSQLYTDATLSTTTTNPIQTDGLGNYGAGIAAGIYYSQIYGPGVTTSLRQFIVSVSATGVTGCTTVGGIAYQNGTNNTLTCAGGLAWNNSTGVETLTGTSTSGETLVNPNPATSLANADSPIFSLIGQAWLGAGPSSVTRTYTIQMKNGALLFVSAGSAAPLVPYQFDNNISTPGSIAAASATINFSAGSAGNVYPVTSAANAVGNTTTYAYTAPTGGAPNLGQNITITGFVAHASNNGTFVVQGGTLTTLTVFNSSGAAETQAATATVDNVYTGADAFSGYSYSTGNPSVATFPISGISQVVANQFASIPYVPGFVSVVKGDAVDAGYWRHFSDGAAVSHGLEIGSIVDSTGASPIIFKLAYFNGARAATFNAPIVSVGANCTNGELGLSGGWQSTGSATVTAVAGTGQTCSWTITTGTTTGANPTVTDTLTNALPLANTVCEMNIHGGSHTPAAGEGFTQTTLSATAPIFTFIGTPTATGATYFVTRRCGP